MSECGTGGGVLLLPVVLVITRILVKTVFSRFRFTDEAPAPTGWSDNNVCFICEDFYRPAAGLNVECCICHVWQHEGELRCFFYSITSNLIYILLVCAPQCVASSGPTIFMGITSVRRALRNSLRTARR